MSHDKNLKHTIGLLESLLPDISEQLPSWEESANCLLQLFQHFEEHRKVAKITYQLSSIQESLWNEIHSANNSHWTSVPTIIRDFYSFATVLQSYLLIDQSHFFEALQVLDKALLVGGPILHKEIQKIISLTEDQIQSTLETPPMEGKRKTRPEESQPLPKRICGTSQEVISTILKKPIQVLDVPISLDEFDSKYVKTNTPVIIKNLISHWRAFSDHDWQNMEYLKSVAGNRTVPIELGGHYLQDDWSQQLMTVKDFIEKFIESPSERSGYLAQVRLFDLIPSLRKDIAVPEYCSICSIGEENDLLINAWFGPKNTITPCHFDPMMNLLCQVVGEKYIRLYDPCYSQSLYPVAGSLYNNSQVDVENPDLHKYPKFAYILDCYQECILTPGDALFIPPKFWHYVRSLSVSFSVSFWW